MTGLWNGSEDASVCHLSFSVGKIFISFISDHFEYDGGKTLVFAEHCCLFQFLQLAWNRIYHGFVETKRQLGVVGFMCEMRPAKLSAQSFKSSWPSAHIWFLGARWIDCTDPTVAGLAVWAAALERKPQPGKPHPLGEPVHHSPLPEPSPARKGCDLWGGVQTPPQRAYAARGPAHTWACAGQSASSGCVYGRAGVTKGLSRVQHGDRLFMYWLKLKNTSEMTMVSILWGMSLHFTASLGLFCSSIHFWLVWIFGWYTLVPLLSQLLVEWEINKYKYMYRKQSENRLSSLKFQLKSDGKSA